jgi:tetratricopeptide (TPR) repeat protein
MEVKMKKRTMAVLLLTIILKGVLFSLENNIATETNNPIIAETLITGLIEKDPGSHLLYYTRASLRIKLNLLDGAVEDLDNAIAIKSDEAVYYFTHVLKNADPRREDIEYVYLNRGLVYELLDELQLALDDLNQTLVIDPNHLTALKHRARIKAKLGDFYGAGLDYWQDEQNWDRRLSERK